LKSAKDGMKIYRENIQKHKDTEREKANFQTDPFKYVPDEYKQVARGLEQQFAEYMVQNMHKSIGNDSKDGTALDYYKNLLHTEEAKNLTEVNNGLGLQKMILNQIYPEKFRNKEALSAYQASQNKDIYNKNSIELEGPLQKSSIEIKKKDFIGNPSREATHE